MITPTTLTSASSGVNNLPRSAICASKKMAADRYPRPNTTGAYSRSFTDCPTTYEITDHSTRLKIANSDVETTMPILAVASDAATSRPPLRPTEKLTSNATISVSTSTAITHSNTAKTNSPALNAAVSCHSLSDDISERVCAAPTTSIVMP